jgi:NADH-quinone oxidoreductase subunit G
MGVIVVDGKTYEVDEKENLLHACLSVGLDLPYFCWHPAMGSIGACRQCAVVQYRDDKDTTGRVVMACMTPAANNARLSIAAPAAVTFRASVVEWLMLNHPHDCPVCEEGGECHLQDMTVMTGHTARRYRGRKRTFANQYLGPFLNHEMNRCITCYRCVRFYRDYAGGDDLAAFGSRDRMYFGRAEDGVLENPFAGNLVEVCPTGVFTDKPASKAYTRKWDLQSAPSICGGCGVGCNTFPAERYGTLRRVHNRYHHDLNGYFLCDRGRFGAGFVNSDVRLKRAGVRRPDGSFDEIAPEAALAEFVSLLRQGVLVGIGSPRASVEANFALRALVGAENFCPGFALDEEVLIADALALLHAAPDASPTLAEVEQADAVLILGEDILNTAPRAALALRQASRNRTFGMADAAQIPQWQDAGVRSHGQQAKSPLYSATPLPTQCDDLATATIHAPAAQLAAIGEAIAAVLAGKPIGELDAAATQFVDAAAVALQQAERPLIVSGTGAMSHAVLAAAGSILRTLRRKQRSTKLLLAVPECNSIGAAMVGGISLEQVLTRAERGTTRTFVVLENDLYRRALTERVTQALAAVNLVVLDSIETRTAEAAELVLPTSTVVESEGTFVNYEGRAQRFFAVFEPPSPIRPAWRWIAEAGAELGRNELQWRHVDEVIASCDEDASFAGIAAAAPTANYRGPALSRVPRQPHRYSGRTAMYADRTIHEPKAAVDEESPLAFSMEGINSGEVGALIPYVWSPGWNSNQAVTRFQQEVGGPLRGGDPGVRLIRPSARAAAIGWPEPSRDITSVDSRPGLRMLVVHEIFGTDELSALSPPIKERIPAAYIVLNPDDAAQLSVVAGSGVRARALERSFEVRVNAAVPQGTAAYPRGLAGLSMPPEWVVFERDPDFAPPVRIIARL